MSKLRFHNRFIYVGIDTSIYALLTGGRSSYPPVLAYTVPTFRCGFYLSVLLCYLVLPAARSCADWDDDNKDNV